MNNEIRDYLTRPKRAQLGDGTGEMAFGIMLLGFTSLGYIQTVLPKTSIWRHGLYGQLLFWGVIIIMECLMLGIPRLIRRHITWPRTGYVKYPSGGRDVRRKRTALFLVAGILAGTAGAGVAILHHVDGQRDWLSLLWIGNALIGVAAYAWFVYRFLGPVHPWKWFVLVFMALGLLTIAFIGADDILAARWVMGWFIGGVWMASGLVTLGLLIRDQKPLTPETA